MKKTICFTDFYQEFVAYGRAGQFSVEGLETLFEYYEQLEEDTGQEIELHVVEICCDWTEYTFEELKGEFDEVAECEDIREAAEALADLGMVLIVPGDPVTLLLSQ